MPIHLLFAFVLAAAPARAEPGLRELARAQDYASWTVLRDALQSAGAADRAEAAFALGQLGMVEIPEGSTEPPTAAMTRAAAADALAAVVSDPDPRVRRAAVEALGKTGGANMESFLLSAATDADPGVRGAAALALFRARFLKRVPEYSTAAVARLTALGRDADPEVRWRAAYAFTRWPEPRAAAVLAVLQDDADERARLFAVRSLAKLKTAPDAARLSDADVYVRAEAVSAFSAAKAWDKLPDALFADPSAHVRAAAADAAGDSGDAARFGPLLIRLAAGPGTLAPGRALIALARLRVPEAPGLIERARLDPRWWIRARAYEAAAFLPAASDLLREGIADPDPRVSSQALETLAASTSPVVAGEIEKVLADPRAPLETLGTAVDAAGERAA
ncbi:MAG: HEAT repeat domain-containing protein, partial [Elusimicrobia bacterium]|nr:HEAT repeat domain-containing protein [Elusimicrobiota bacterium]